MRQAGIATRTKNAVAPPLFRHLSGALSLAGRPASDEKKNVHRSQLLNLPPCVRRQSPRPSLGQELFQLGLLPLHLKLERAKIMKHAFRYLAFSFFKASEAKLQATLEVHVSNLGCTHPA